LNLVALDWGGMDKLGWLNKFRSVGFG
jgi:hypothetical protein